MTSLTYETRNTNRIIELEKLSLKEKTIYTFRIWFGMKVILKTKIKMIE